MKGADTILLGYTGMTNMIRDEDGRAAAPSTSSIVSRPVS
jgi:hypothetical protein